MKKCRFENCGFRAVRGVIFCDFCGFSRLFEAEFAGFGAVIFRKTAAVFHC
jgi:hypothetical protein